MKRRMRMEMAKIKTKANTNTKTPQYKDLGVLGHGPKAEDNLVRWIVVIGQLVQVCVEELVVFVIARLVATSLLQHMRQRSGR